MFAASRIKSLVAGVTVSGWRIEAGGLSPDQLRRALREWHPGRLEIDLRGVDRIAPDLVRLLAYVVTRQRSNGGVVALVNASPSVVRRLMGHGIADLLPAMPWTADGPEHDSPEAEGRGDAA